jgi:hypothetical protein
MAKARVEFFNVPRLIKNAGNLREGVEAVLAHGAGKGRRVEHSGPAYWQDAGARMILAGSVS